MDVKEVNSQSVKTGTREWSEHSVNIQVGCENCCRYCYARHRAVHVYKYCEDEDWKEPRINQEKADRDYPTRKGVTMFPTTHDITDRNISECLCVINHLLDSGNKVLIVSKPRMSCIPVICESIKKNFPNFWQGRVTFRFTIGSVKDAVLYFWEPGAPGFLERHNCLRHAFDAGFATSVSCEPYLDAWPHYVYEAVIDYLTGDFWLGMLRDFDKRVVTDGVTLAENAIYVRPLKELQSTTAVRTFYNYMKDRPQVRFKDSVRKVIERL